MTTRMTTNRYSTLRRLALAALLSASPAGAQVETPDMTPDPAFFHGSLGSFVTVQGVYIRALGPIGDVYGGAAGFSAGYGVHFPDPYLLLLQGGYADYGEWVNPEDGGVEKLRLVNLMATPRLYLGTDEVMPFVSLGIGVNIVNERYLDNGLPVDKTGMHFAWQFGFGLMVALYGPVGLDLTAAYNNSFYDYGQGHDNPENRMLTGFQYNAGLNWFFAR